MTKERKKDNTSFEVVGARFDKETNSNFHFNISVLFKNRNKGTYVTNLPIRTNKPLEKRQRIEVVGIDSYDLPISVKAPFHFFDLEKEKTKIALDLKKRYSYLFYKGVDK